MLIISIIYLIMLALRNEIVYNVSLKFANNDINAYRKLPSYAGMVINPRYYLMWTYDSFKNYIERK